VRAETLNDITTTYTFGYDAAGRLARVGRDNLPVSEYTYDENGNRLTKTVAGRTEIAAYDVQDRLLTYDGKTYTYAPAGELASKTDSAGTTRYDYDPLGNLRSVKRPDGLTVEYILDAANRRVGKKVNGVLVRAWLYSGPSRVIAELDGAGALVSRFVYGTRGNVPEYMVRGGTTYRIITDHLGSPRLVVDAATGAVVESVGYDEYGVVVSDSNVGFQPFGYAGGLYDADTALVHFGARDYDAEVGRWTTKDPIGLSGGDADFYTYVGDDPINFRDPSGLDQLTADPHMQEMMEDLWKYSGSGMRPEEQGAWVTQDPTTSKYSCVPWPQTHESNALSLRRGWTKPPNTVAIVHTHPAVGHRTQEPDDAGDRQVAQATQVPIYTITKQNGIGKYDPATGQASKEEPSINFPNTAKDGCSCHR
jgi:RHS repeat-associated protein